MTCIHRQEAGFHLSIFDIVFGVVILAAGTFFGASIAIGPVAWDDTLYLHTAWALAADPTILNRYTHIFLLRLGIALAGGNPFSGAFLAGAFSFSLTALLVYLNARILSKSAHPLHGLLALLILLAEPLYLENFGIPLADFTAMLMISLGIFCYLITVRQDRLSLLFLALNGFIFFLSIKSKEVCTVLIILLIALVFINNWPFHWRTTTGRLLAILGGIASGILFFILLDGLLLKDPWFGLRLSDFQALVSFNVGQEQNFSRQAGSYFGLFTRIGLLAPFCLAIASAFWLRSRLEGGEWAIWLLIPGITAALSIGQIYGAFGVLDRYAIPSLPVLAILAPQFIHFDQPENIPLPAWAIHLAILGLLAVASLITYEASREIFSWLGKPAGWSQVDFLTSILEPLALCLLLPVALFLPANHRVTFIVTIFLILTLTIPQIQIYRRNLVTGLPRQASLDRFSPMTLFKDQVSCTSGKVYVSGHYHDDLDLLSRDQQSSYWMFDLSFDCISQKSQFDLSKSPSQILTTPYQYAFITKHDFDDLMANPDQAMRLQQMYSIANNPQQSYYVLTKK